MDIKLISKEGKIFHISEEVACQCEIIVIEEVGGEDIIPIPDVSTEALELVIEWCNKHTIREMKNMNVDELKEWETKFFDVDGYTLYRLFLAAKFFCHEALLDRLYEDNERVISISFHRALEDAIRSSRIILREEYDTADLFYQQ